MKKKLLVLSVVSVALLSFVAEKFVIIKFKEEQVNYHWQNLNNTKQLINRSSLPHDQVVYIIGSIDSLQKDIQLNVTIDSTSTSKK
jgi:hypothetical protein